MSRRGYGIELMKRGAVLGTAAAFAFLGVARLALAICHFASPSSPVLAASASFLGGGVAALVALAAGAALALRALPSREKWRALLDDAAHAGGLILVEKMSGADLWPRPAPVAVRPPPWNARRALAALAASAALFAASAVAAGSLAADVLPGANAVVPEELIAESVAEIEELAKEAAVPDQQLEELREEVARIVAEARQRDAAETLDALNRVAERLRAASAMAQAEGLLAKDKALPRMGAAEFAALQKELSDTLAKSPSSRDRSLDPNFNRKRCSGGGRCSKCGGKKRGGKCSSGGNCEGGDEGEACSGESCGKPGSGGVSRGRGDAIISWTDPAKLGDSKLKDVEREADPTGDETEWQGEELSEWDPAEMPGFSGGGGAAAPLRRAIGAGTAQKRVLPRHRDAVRRFFSNDSPERNEK